MTDETQTPQTDPGGRKRGGRKAGSPAPEGNGASDIPEVDQALGEEGILPGSAQAIAPIPFDFRGKTIRTITEDGEVWFVAADVCAVLEHGNPTRAVERLDEDERGLITIQAPAGNDQKMNVVSESGLYNLVFTSRKPEAKAFRLWVTGTVLPTLRRTGKFDMTGEPGDKTGDGPAAGLSRNGITLSLPGPGRYLVVLYRDGDRRIEPLAFSDTVSALAGLDCRSVAYSFLTAAALWEKLQHVRAVGRDTGKGFTFEKLSETMQAGADLARQILYTYDEPILVPRQAAAE